MNEERADGQVNDIDAGLAHPWLRINRVLRVDAAHALERGGVGSGQVEVKKALALRSEILRAGWFN
jgi:hypothetical protein